jgi:superfamily II DNA or RNA helicase
MGIHLQVGSRVRRVSDPVLIGVVLRVEAGFASVFWTSGREETLPADSLELDEPVVACSGPRDLLLRLTARRLQHPLTDQLLSYKASRTKLLPHQFVPVRKLLANPARRLLVADEVGTGKTIEAGLIWAELEARSRGGLGSVLVICPKALTEKWQLEFVQRFDLFLEILDSEALRQSMAAFERDGVWSPRLSHAIVGLELARREESLEAMQRADCSWDLVIIDEAHHLRNPETASFALAAFISDRTQSLVFLTATPVQTTLENLRSLMRLLGVDVASDPILFCDTIDRDSYLTAVCRLVKHRPPGWRAEAERRLDAAAARYPKGARSIEDLRLALPAAEAPLAERLAYREAVTAAQGLAPYITRTMRGDVEARRATRQAAVHRVAFAPPEDLFYNKVYAVVSDRATSTGTPPGFLIQMPARRTASCPSAVAEEIVGLAEENEESPEHLASFSRAEVTELLPAAREVLAATDQKVARLIEVLRATFAEGHDRAMVFSTFKGTLRCLRRHLVNAGFTVNQIDGDVPARDLDCHPGQVSRAKIAHAFRRGEFQVLLGSEVVGEGLDFEHCAVMVNYDLPWNPMRVEQRIGRIDRFGQTADKLLILNLVTKETIEERILDRLYLRLGIFENALGEFEAVLGEQLEVFGRDVFKKGLSPAQQDARLEQIARAVEEQRRQRAQIDAEHGALLATVQRVETEREEFQRLEQEFLAPTEIRDFVVAALSAVAPQAVKERGDIIQVDLSAFDAQLSQLSKGLPPASRLREGVRRFENLARRSSPTVLVSFEDTAKDGVEFAHVRHPLVLLARHLTASSIQRVPLAVGTVAAASWLSPGEYVLGWGIASYDGMLPRVELIEAGLHARSAESIAIPPDCRLLDLVRAAAPCSTTPAPDTHELGRRLERELARRAETGKEVLVERNVAAAARARAAVTATVEHRRAWLDERLTTKNLDARLARMFTSWRDRLDRELEAKIGDLTRRAMLSFSVEVIGTMYLEVGG